MSRALALSVILALFAGVAMGCSSASTSGPVPVEDSAPAGEDTTVEEDAVGDVDVDAGCVKKTCAEIGAECGSVSDGCGGKVNCGTCPVTKSCGGGGVANKCGGCTPFTCAALSKNCGTVANGCGGVISCGTCTAPHTCGGGGVLNVCGCTPTTCAAAGKNCGTMTNGCGVTLNCGTCPSGQTCGGAGVANVCGVAPCVKTTCAALGKNCGNVSDGCSGLLDCGTCAGVQTCGGGGTANVCGCTRKTCSSLSATCGNPSDGCGGTLSCGSCTSPSTCGGGGTPNTCGCTPTSCAALGAECGTPSNGCGAPLPSCGTCATGSACNATTFKCECVKKTCAELGKVCGTASDGCGGTLTCSGCPSGFGCTTGDVCVASEVSTTAICSLQGWCYAHPLPQPSTLRRVFATSATDVWAVGANGTILHYDGTRWTGVAGLGNVTYNDVWASSATDVWAIATGLVVHGDGAGNWQYIPLPESAKTTTLRAVWGTSASDVTIVGGDGSTPLMLRWNGSGLSIETPPTGSGYLQGVWRSSSAGTFIVGSGGIFHNDGTSWTREDTSTTMRTIWGSGTSVFAGGDAWTIKRRIGTTWVTMTTPSRSASSVIDINGTSDTNVYAVGNGYVDVWNGTSWSNLLISTSTSPTGVAAASGLDVMAVGTDGAIWTRKGTTWSSVAGPQSDSFTAISAFATDDLWVGGNSRLRHWNGASWDASLSANIARLWPSAASAAMFVDTYGNFYRASLTATTYERGSVIDLWGSSSNDVWAVGTGRTEHRVSGTWSTVTNPLTGTTASLRAVWGSADNDVWAVGDLGYVLHWDGTSWSLSTTLSGGPTLNALWGSSATNVWALTTTSRMYRWDGASWTSVPTTEIYTSISGTASDLWLVGPSGLQKRSGTTTTPVVTGIPATFRAVHIDRSAGIAWAVGDKAIVVYGPP